MHLFCSTLLLLKTDDWLDCGMMRTLHDAAVWRFWWVIKRIIKNNYSEEAFMGNFCVNRFITSFALGSLVSLNNS